MQKQVVVFISPPGGGKGTQADLLAQKFGFYHLETSKILEEKLAKENDSVPEIVEARRLYEAGQLVTPSMVARLVLEEIRKLHGQEKSIVFSGSFRTLEEAQKEIPIVEELYGQENIKIFNITLSEGESVKRNSGRRICQKSRHPIPNFPEYQNISVCPWDGSPVITRTLDKPEIIRKRYQVFLEDTRPVLDFLKQKGYNIITINGERPIEKVFEDILRHFK